MKRLKADLLLISVAFFWGATFIISKNVLTRVPLSVYLTARLGIAAIFLWLSGRIFHRSTAAVNPIHGLILGSALFGGYFFQMWGIQHTSASNAGFITGLSVIIVPLISWLLLKKNREAKTVFSGFLAAGGLFLLTGSPFNYWNWGDALVLLCAFFFAAHILLTEQFVRSDNVLALTQSQLTGVALMSLAVWFFKGFPLVELSLKDWGWLIFLAITGTVYPYLMQTSLQRYTTAARTAIIFSLEPVFAAYLAYEFGNEHLTAAQLAGGVLIVLAMILTELPLGRKKG